MGERFRRKSTGCRNAGDILTDGNDVVNRWKEYVQNFHEGTKDIELLPERLPTKEPNGEQDRTHKTEEFSKAIKQPKNSEAPDQMA
jgi:hypothetical protein